MNCYKCGEPMEDVTADFMVARWYKCSRCRVNMVIPLIHKVNVEVKCSISDPEPGEDK